MGGMREFIAECCPDAVVWEPADYDEALVGVVERCGLGPVAAYDYLLLVEVTMKLGSGDYEEAVEHVNHNITGSFVGEHTPMVLHRPLEE